MLRTTLSKIKKICSIAIVPRIFQGDAKNIQKKFTKHSILASRATTTTSSSNTGSKDTEQKNAAEGQHIHVLEKPDENINKTVAQAPDNVEACNRIIKKIFEESTGKPLEATVNATPKPNEELTQKVEKIDETPVVLPPLQVEEQTIPKVMGNQEVLSASKDEELSDNSYDPSFDDLAHRCLHVPINEVDEYILKELRQYHAQTRGNAGQGYYSQAVYNNPQQIIQLGRVQTSIAPGVYDQNILQKIEEESIVPVKVDVIQLIESISAYGRDLDEIDGPSFETPLILNPYDNNLIFPLDDYILKEDFIETPQIEETMIVNEALQEDKVRNDEAMPPAEMEIETEQAGVGKQLQGTVAGISLVPEDITTSKIPEFAKMTEMDDRAFLYTHTHTHQPPRDPPSDWQTQIGQHNERQPVIPNTSISGKITDWEKKKQQQVSDSAISSHQNLHDLYIQGINRDNVVFASKDSEIKDLSSEKPNIRKNPITNIIFDSETKPLKERIPKVETASKAKSEGAKNPEKSPQNLNSNIASTAGPISETQETNVPLKEMLRRIRERHRQELCRDFFQQATQVHLSTSCKPVKMPFPNPCKPRPKEKSECPPPAKGPDKKDSSPAKKDPCAKFSHLRNVIHNTICFLRLSHWKNFGNPMPVVNYQPCKQYSQAISTSTLRIHCLNSLKEDPLEVIGSENVGDIILARDYEPWTPIPSWPIPKKEIKRKLVCPKDGCKLIPPPPLGPAEKDKPCVTFPKKTFSLAELFEHQAVTRARY